APRFRDIVHGFDRRRFLQLMAASMALGGLSGCGPEEVTRQLVPYVEAPPYVVPGRNRYYTGATIQDGYATGVLVAHQMARPIKVEGNPDHPASLGAASAIMQASILDLYDPRRAQTVFGEGHIATWDSFVTALDNRRETLLAKKGEGLRILTGAVTSPLFAAQMAKLQQQLPGMRWHQWEPLHRDHEFTAATHAYGQAVEKIFDLSKADRIFGIESDLISASPGSLAYARKFAAARRPTETGGRMSRVYAIESTPTLLGAKADHRLAMRPDEIVAALRYLAGLLGAGPGEWTQAENAHSAWLKAVADDLNQNKGRALLHAGREQAVEVHVLTDVINHALGAHGSTINLIAPIEAMPGSKQQSISELAGDMASGKIDTLIILGANPVYDAPPELDFAARLRGVPFSVSLARYDDETAVACKWRVPAVHEYESWSDARAFDGTVTILQPQARPLYGGHSGHEILAVLLGDSSPDSYTLLRDFWQQRAQEENRGAFDDFWHKALQVGIVADTAASPQSLTPKSDTTTQLQGTSAAATPALQALFRADEGNWDGRYANNPWLLEMPRAFTRLTWDNAALIAPGTAKRLGLKTGDVVEIAFAKTKLKAPVYVLPGQAADCVTLPLGWGRTVGGLASGAGFNAYAARGADTAWAGEIISLTRTGETYRLATTQDQDRVLGRDLVLEGELEQFNSDPGKIVPPKKTESLYPPFQYPDRAWAMSIDLDSCIGCQACVVACQAENNVPIVGKDQVLAGRAMHWLRIDRYYSGSADTPDIAFEPMPCMHCEQAPCEVV